MAGRIRAVGGCVRVGGDYLRYLKKGWNKKEGRGNKDFKKEGKAGSRGECLKKRGAGTSLRTMLSFFEIQIQYFHVDIKNPFPMTKSTFNKET